MGETKRAYEYALMTWLSRRLSALVTLLDEPREPFRWTERTAGVMGTADIIGEFFTGDVLLLRRFRRLRFFLG